MNFTFIIAASGTDISPVFAYLATIAVALIAVSLLLIKLRQSLIIGYFLCGAVMTNSGLPELIGMNPNEGFVSHLSEIGVILLMFTLGIEFSISELKHLSRIVVKGGIPQVLLTVGIVTLIAINLGASPSLAAVFGVCIALSSTAVSLKAFSDLGIVHCPSARSALGIALFQDVFVIGFMVALPLIAGQGTELNHAGFILLKLSVFTGVMFLLGKYIIPKTLGLVAATRSRELFTLTVLALCTGVAFLAHVLGLSLALGAFVAGLVVSESIYSHRVLNDILPFKDLFLTIFFLSIGMLIEVEHVLQHWWKIILFVILVFLGKGLILFWRGRAMKLSPKHALICAASLAGTGEFSLVLLTYGMSLFEMSEPLTQIFITSTALMMAFTPSLMKGMIRLADLLGWKQHETFEMQKEKVEDSLATLDSLHDHGVICGFGPVGQAIHKAFCEWGIPSVITDLNAHTIKRVNQEGHLALFADASHAESQMMLRMDRARVVAITFPDHEMVTKTITEIRHHYPEVIIIARAKFASNVEKLYNAGATEVVLDETEVGKAIVSTAFESYQINDLQ